MVPLLLVLLLLFVLFVVRHLILFVLLVILFFFFLPGDQVGAWRGTAVRAVLEGDLPFLYLSSL